MSTYQQIHGLKAAQKIGQVNVSITIAGELEYPINCQFHSLSSRIHGYSLLLITGDTRDNTQHIDMSTACRNMCPSVCLYLHFGQHYADLICIMKAMSNFRSNLRHEQKLNIFDVLFLKEKAANCQHDNISCNRKAMSKFHLRL